MFDKLNNQNTPKLDSARANQMLQNVLDTCGYKPNTVPLPVLESKKAFYKKIVTIPKVLTVFAVLIGVTVPALLIKPSFTVTRIDEIAYKPTYEIDVESLLPVDSVSASLDGEEVALLSPESKIFSADPNGNGTLTITVTLINGQSASQSVQVTGVDCKAPTIVVETPTDNCIRLYVTDDFSGVNYETVYGIDEDGNPVQPLSVDPETGIITFPYHKAVLDVYISDMAGNQTYMTVIPTITFI